MSIRDIIKKSFLESAMFNQAISPSMIMTIVADLTFALVMGLLIYWVYKRTFAGVVYSHSFAITLVGMAVLTCMVTLAISTNIVISLGMVGALSIVRYRTAIKEPMDLMYLFWSITTGITAGASMYILSLLASVVMIVLVFAFRQEGKGAQSYILVVNYTGNEAGDEIIRQIGRLNYKLRSQVNRGQDTELTIQLRCKADRLTVVDKIKVLPQVKDATLLSFNGEYHA